MPGRHRPAPGMRVSTQQARLNVSLPDLPRDVAQDLINAAHQICPYSKMSRGNIDVTVTLAE